MPPKTHIGPYLAFLTTKYPKSWIIFNVLLMTELCALFPGRFCIVIMVSMGISVIWRKFSSKTHIGPYVPFSITETHGIWIIFHVLPLTKLFPLFLGSFALLFVFPWAFLSFGGEKSPQNTYGAVFTLPDNKITWTMNQFSCVCND